MYYSHCFINFAFSHLPFFCFHNSDKEMDFISYYFFRSYDQAQSSHDSKLSEEYLSERRIPLNDYLIDDSLGVNIDIYS